MNEKKISDAVDASEYKPLFRDSNAAFQNALNTGAFSASKTAPNSIYHFMYMHTEACGADAFKHVNTRKYVYIKNEKIKKGKN